MQRVNVLLLTGMISVMTTLVMARPAAPSAEEKHIQVALRMIGHQVLLSVGDSSSLVMPIIDEFGRYRIQFESEISILPDELKWITDSVVRKSELAAGYIVEVEACESRDIVYAFEVGAEEQDDIVPCMGRELPRSCYNILFTITRAFPGSAELNEDASKSEVNYLLIVLGGLGFIGLIAFLIRRRKNETIHNDPNVISLGKYRFDKLNGELIIAEQRIELTSKESELLLLLYDTVNTTVERDVLLNKVWGDEGDYIGRTLDSTVKIVNVRGVGYKLILNG